MNLSTLELEDRIGCLLATRLRAAGQLNGLDDAELAGIGKKLKKVAKGVGKVVRKVAPIAVGAGTLYLGARAVKNMTASPQAKAASASKKASKKAAKAAKKAGKLGLQVAPAAAALALQPDIPPESAAALRLAIDSGALQSQPSAGAQLVDTAGQIATAYMAAQGVQAQEAGMQQIVRDAVASQAAQPRAFEQVQPRASGRDSAPDELPEIAVTARRSWLWPALGAAAIGGLVLMSNKGAHSA